MHRPTQRRPGSANRPPAPHLAHYVLQMCFASALLFPTEAVADNPEPGALASSQAVAFTPAQLHQQIGQLRADIELIRQHLGKRSPRHRTFKISNAETRQLFFQAQTLFRKCNHLAMDFTVAERQAPPPAPAGNISTAEVQALLASAHEQLILVKQELGIEQRSEPPRLERRRTASDALHGIVEAGNVLNQLTMTPATWEGIYDRIVQMLTYLGGALPEDNRYPALAPYVCCKQPEDVYVSLATTLRGLAPLAEQVQLNLLKVRRIQPPEGGASTSTVYDLTTTMVSDIGEITLRLENADDVAPPDYPRPGRILPAHAWQLAQALGTQLERLSRTAVSASAIGAEFAVAQN